MEDKGIFDLAASVARLAVIGHGDVRRHMIDTSPPSGIHSL